MIKLNKKGIAEAISWFTAILAICLILLIFIIVSLVITKEKSGKFLLDEESPKIVENLNYEKALFFYFTFENNKTLYKKYLEEFYYLGSDPYEIERGLFLTMERLCKPSFDSRSRDDSKRDFVFQYKNEDEMEDTLDIQCD